MGVSAGAHAAMPAVRADDEEGKGISGGGRGGRGEAWCRGERRISGEGMQGK